MTGNGLRPIPAFVNPLAKRAPEALEALSGDHRFETHEIAPERLAEAVTHASREGASRVLVAGGDGSLATAAGALAGTRTELALLAGGTLNHFARDLEVPTEAADALTVAASSQATRAVDVGRVNGRVFLNTSSVGAYVSFVRWREHLEPRLGYLLASVVAGVRLLGRMRNFHVGLDVGGEAQRFRTPLIFAGVGERELQLPTLGGRVTDGGRGLHLFVVHGRGRARLIALGLAATLAGRKWLTRGPHLDSVLVERFTIDLDLVHVNVAVDGEIVLMEAPLEYELLRDAVRVVVPG